MVKQQVDLKTHPLRGMSLIEASAGTGKTFTISHLYLRCLLETDYQVRQLLVVTFTNAATQELRGRIRNLIYDVSRYLENIKIKNHDFDTLFGEYRLQDDALVKLQRALINFDEASIYSIHGFCQRILNSFPIETQSLLEQQIIPDEKQMLLQAIRDYWRKFIINTELSRLRWILQNWKDPDRLLRDVQPLLSFDKTVQQLADKTGSEKLLLQLQPLWQQLTGIWQKQRNELQDILIDSPALKRNSYQKDTVNRLLDSLIRLFNDSLPYELPEKWELLTTGKIFDSLKKDSNDPRLEHEFFNLAGVFAELHRQWLHQQKLELLTDATLFVQTSINSAKSQAQNISFNDLIKQVAVVVNADNPRLLDRITDLYPVAMVDEFQDTDQRQYHIFKTLYQDREDSALILIGDPKQAIYSFRGADVFTYQQAKQATGQQYTLETNYRSSARYVDMVNQLFLQHDNAFVYRQLIEFEPARASADDTHQLSENGNPAAPMICWMHPPVEKPLPKTDAGDYFARLCAQQIRQLLQQQHLLIDGKPVQARDLTVLVRTGRQAVMIKNQLAAQGISCAMQLRDSVFASEQAREISLLLEVIIEPGNINRLCGLLSTDLFGWHAAGIFQLQQDNQRLVELLEQFSAYHQHWLDKGVLSMFFRIIGDHQVLSRNLAQVDGERRVTNWLHIMELLQQQSAQHASQSQALHWLQLQREQTESLNDIEEHQLRLESDSELVKVVTIHKSKGLEYPIVFLPFAWDIPSNRNQPKSYSYHDEAGYKRLMVYDETQRARWHEENLAEQVRLFYVAVTRAKYRCYLGWGNIKGAGSSAIANCLYARTGQQGTYPQDLDVQDHAQLLEAFERLNRQQHVVDIIEAQPEQQNIMLSPVKTIGKVSARNFQRKLEQQWRISSYSQLASSGHSDLVDRPDYDALPAAVDTDLQVPGIFELNRFSFAKGAKAGNFLHEILERQDFNQAANQQTIRQKCVEYGYDEKWIKVIADWIDQIVQCNLNGFSLSDIGTAQKICEMEFYLTIGQLQAGNLNSFLRQHDYLLEHQGYSFNDISGFLKGFIDLVFEHDGRYFIADYKSNYLGPAPIDYNEAGYKTAMYEHHYHLQYLIYTLALHRYLKLRIPDYDYERHFGGVYYLFLRGMYADDDQQNGIFFHRPEAAVLEKLELSFD